MRVLVIGGTGSFSTRVTQKALARGHDVLVYARGRRPLLDGLAVRWLRADRAELRAPADELARFAPEVVVDAICFDRARAGSGRAARLVGAKPSPRQPHPAGQAGARDRRRPQRCARGAAAASCGRARRAARAPGVGAPLRPSV